MKMAPHHWRYLSAEFIVVVVFSEKVGNGRAGGQGVGLGWGWVGFSEGKS